MLLAFFKLQDFWAANCHLFYIYTATNLPVAFSCDLYINVCQHKWNNSNYNILFNNIQQSRPPILTALPTCMIWMLLTNADLFCLAKFYSEMNHLYLHVVLSFYSLAMTWSAPVLHTILNKRKKNNLKMAGSGLSFWCQECIKSLKKGSNELSRIHWAERKKKEKRSLALLGKWV